MAGVDLQAELTRAVSKTEWTVKGIIHIDERITPLPPESRVVTELFQSILIEKLKAWAKSKNFKIDDHADYGRGYPDMTLRIKDRLIAIDIKSARFKQGDRISIMTLGTYDGYFLHPDNRVLHGKTRCYNDYEQHWVVSVIYEWHPDKPTMNMVKIISICVGQKWQFAGRVSGSGDTANIGGINSLSRLQNLESEFHSNEEFENYWRDYSIKHPRKRTKAP